MISKIAYYDLIYLVNQKILQQFQVIVNGLTRYLTHTRLGDCVNMSDSRKILSMTSIENLVKRQSLKLAGDWHFTGILDKYSGRYHQSARLFVSGAIKCLEVKN